jgi:hypothetical protein
MAIHTFGPGTLTLDPAGTAASFECQVKSFTVTHEYNETAERVEYLGAGCVSEAVQTRADSLSFDIDHALDATGLYKYCLDNDLQTVAFEYVPNTSDTTPAQWAGEVTITVPPVEGSEYGARLSGSVSWAGVGQFTFTAAVA